MSESGAEATSYDQDHLELIALNLKGRVGPASAAASLVRKFSRYRRRRSLFECATTLGMDAPPEWNRLPGGTTETLLPADWEAARVEAARVGAYGARITTWLDGNYPYNLRMGSYPPPVLYCRGNLVPADRAAVAIVGSRRATKDYNEFAADLAYRLAKSGVTVVSGLARGVDRSAHEGALAAGGRTLAVLGSGIDVVYPKGHAGLARRIAANGALLSYYPMGTPPLPYHFPARNWVIALLSLGVVIVQAARKSGALITAGFAGALGREVMAVPGHVEHPMSEGPHGLLRDGAALVDKVEDVLHCLDNSLRWIGLTVADAGAGVATDIRPAGPAIKASGRVTGAMDPHASLADRLMQKLAGGPAGVGELAAALQTDVAAVQSALVRMEIERRVKSIGGGRYRRVAPERNRPME